MPGDHGRGTNVLAVDLRQRPTASEVTLIILGIILLVLGLVLGINILYVLGIILLVIGAVLFLLGSTGRAVGGRNHYF
jgi:uncharacterized membrane protein